jgi:hypothetical protein
MTVLKRSIFHIPESPAAKETRRGPRDSYLSRCSIEFIASSVCVAVVAPVATAINSEPLSRTLPRSSFAVRQHRLLWLKQNDPEKYEMSLAFGNRYTRFWDEPKNGRWLVLKSIAKVPGGYSLLVTYADKSVTGYLLTIKKQGSVAVAVAGSGRLSHPSRPPRH